MYPFLLSDILRGYWFLRPEDVLAGKTIVSNLLSRALLPQSDIFSVTHPITNTVTKVDSNNETNDDIKSDKTVVIPLKGTMLKYGTLCSYGTLEIAQFMEEAIGESDVSSFVLDIDSGGGALNSIDPLVKVIQDARNAGKPVVAFCDICASAAYWVASYCNRIVAGNDLSSQFGSIGVMCSFTDVRPAYEKLGVKFHDIYADHSQNKNEDFRLALEGNYDLIRQECLNPLAVRFQETIKANRPLLKTEIPGILSGKMFFSEEAKKYGMIDDIGSLSTAVNIVQKLAAELTINNYISS